MQVKVEILIDVEDGTDPNWTTDDRIKWEVQQTFNFGCMKRLHLKYENIKVLHEERV